MRNINKKAKITAFVLSIIVITFGIAFAVSAVWQEPASSPPDGNVAPPVNVGSAGQTKIGDLGIQNGNNNALLKSNILSIDGPAVINNMNLSLNGLLVPNGNVGIGTTDPDKKLEVYGDLLLSGASEGYNTGISIPNSDMNVGGGADGIFGIRHSNAGSGLIVFGDLNDGVNWAMAIDTINDRVGIGMMNPSEKLDVNGNVRAAAFFYSSDERLKENIQKLDGSLEKIMKLNGIYFNWKDSGSASIGLTAQNVETVFPELVKTDKVSGMKSVEYGNLVAPLIEAIKEQQEMIENQQKEIDLLKQMINK